MKQKVGVWIDHREAIVVTLTELTEGIKHIPSGVEKHPERSATAEKPGAFESLKVKADDLQQHAFTGHLSTYYDAVIAELLHAEKVLILGPGEAKTELKKRLGEAKTGPKWIEAETADRLTERQLVAKVGEYFRE